MSLVFDPKYRNPHADANLRELTQFELDQWLQGEKTSYRAVIEGNLIVLKNEDKYAISHPSPKLWEAFKEYFEGFLKINAIVCPVDEISCTVTAIELEEGETHEEVMARMTPEDKASLGDLAGNDKLCIFASYPVIRNGWILGLNMHGASEKLGEYTLKTRYTVHKGHVTNRYNTLAGMKFCGESLEWIIPRMQQYGWDHINPIAAMFTSLLPTVLIENLLFNLEGRLELPKAS